MFSRIKQRLNKRKVIKELGTFDEAALWKAIREKRMHLAEILLTSGITADSRDKFGNTVLMLATKMQSTEAIELLLNYKASPNLADSKKTTALMIAAQKGYLMCTQLLINAGAEIDRRNVNGQTALILAVKEGNTGTVRYLLNAYADPNIQDNKGKSVLKYAAFSPSLSKILKEAGAKEVVRISEVEKVVEAIPYLGENVGKVFRDFADDSVEQEKYLQLQEVIKKILQLSQFKRSSDEIDEDQIKNQIDNMNLGLDVLARLKNIIFDLTGILITLYQKSQTTGTHPKTFLSDLNKVLDALDMCIKNLEQEAEDDFGTPK